MTDEKNIPLYNSQSFHTVVSKVLDTYIQEANKTEIRKEAFEESIYWLYERKLKYPKPQIIYCGDPRDLPKIGNGIDRQFKRINACSVLVALSQHIYPLREKLDKLEKRRGKLSKEFFKGQFPQLNVLNTYSGRLLSFIEKYRRDDGVHLKNNIAKIASIDVYIQMEILLLPDFQYLKTLYCSGICHVFFWEGAILAVPTPIIRCDELGLLHSAVYPAIEWSKGPNEYYLHGREMPEWIFTHYGKDTYYNQFLNIIDEDVKAGVVSIVKEREGNEGLLNFLRAELVDEKEIVHFSGYREILKLYKTKEKFRFLRNRHGHIGQPYCWSEFTCPSTGATYLIDNSADFTDAIEAAKFLRPGFIPQELPYQWSHDAC